MQLKRNLLNDVNKYNIRKYTSKRCYTITQCRHHFICIRVIHMSISQVFLCSSSYLRKIISQFLQCSFPGCILAMNVNLTQWQKWKLYFLHVCIGVRAGVFPIMSRSFYKLRHFYSFFLYLKLIRFYLFWKKKTFRVRESDW